MDFCVPEKGRIILPSAVRNRNVSIDYLTIALSVKASEHPDRFFWAKENNFALEYTPDPLFPELISGHVTPFINDGIPVRYHTRFFDFELGNEDASKAGEALQIHKNVVDAVAGLGEQVLTVHLNLKKTIPFSEENAVGNLVELTRYARDKGITICLENLRKGPTSYPSNVIAWAGKADSKITMDMGHAISSDYVKNGNAAVSEIVDSFAPRLHEVHMYGKEEDRHYPIDDMKDMEEPVNHLLRTGCRWWTIELDDYTEALNTRELLLNYLNTLRKEQ
ncbi:MAG: TIM barrel protein [Dehalococcoidales bacterium]|nr:TIM barrel protein [Dehalococcoidales bacterium]